MKREENIGRDQYRYEAVSVLQEYYVAVMEELSTKRPDEDKSDASDLNGEETEYSSCETDSEIDAKDNPVHKEKRNSDKNVCTTYPFNL
ncbi:hypothetical protein AVEN_216202-1 [Araneus ventricosus]|uniref:Uncharacterized protein n=1 Tax=Araneus ventricosus TaxID=182803 RepID=A0A4Y2UKQ6_ARAVE|nr:hypothetical protein AVEN_216202-1 [Araneus ventricosus]